jgi:hypothetical protein
MNEIDFKAAIQHMRPSTQAIYTNLWGRWRNWCKEHDIAHFPITQETLDMFVSEMSLRLQNPTTFTTSHNTLPEQKGGWHDASPLFSAVIELNIFSTYAICSVSVTASEVD